MNIGNWIYEKNSVINQCKSTYIIKDKIFINRKDGIKERGYLAYCTNNHTFEISQSDVNRGRGCPICVNKQVLIGYNDIPTTASWMIPYFRGGIEEAKNYTKQSNKFILPKCPDCGRLIDKPHRINNIYNKHSVGCVCGDGYSYGEKFIYNMLEQLNVNFDKQLTIPNLGKRRFDFGIKDYKLIIEVDGNMGHGRDLKSGWGSELTSEEQIAIDNKKESIANKEGFNVIRIDVRKSSYEYIMKSILDSDLKKYFDINLIDFKECEAFARGNRVKEICNYYMKNKPITPQQIANDLNISLHTSTEYLKKGCLLGWCDYNTKEYLKSDSWLIRKYKKYA